MKFNIKEKAKGLLKSVFEVINEWKSFIFSKKKDDTIVEKTKLFPAFALVIILVVQAIFHFPSFLISIGVIVTLTIIATLIADRKTKKEE